MSSRRRSSRFRPRPQRRLPWRDPRSSRRSEKAKPKATPPGQAKKQQPAARANGNARKEKPSQAKSAKVDPKPAPASPPERAEPAAPHAAPSNAQGGNDEKDNGPKK